MNTPHVASEHVQPDSLPDARRSHHRPTVCSEVGIASQVYCVNCGAGGGQITEQWAEHVFYLCDKCAEKYGEVAGAVKIPDNVVKGIEHDPILEQLIKEK